ncbi:MAG: hypothetical protein NVSMB52_10710 [Chloroflexota bacterium]
MAGTRFSLLIFLITQIVIDLEPLYYLMTDQSPAHRFWLPSSERPFWLSRWRASCLSCGKRRSRSLLDPRESLPDNIWLGALLGTWTHVLLNSVVHLDVAIFGPFHASHPLYGWLEWEAMDRLCLALARDGGSVLWYRRRQSVVVSDAATSGRRS